MSLTDRSKREFIRRGYLTLRGIVPRMKIGPALRVINQKLGSGSRKGASPEHVPFFSDLFNSPELMSLLMETKLWPVVESLLGPGRAQRPQAEVTLGFPNMDASAHFNAKELHIDGLPDKGRRETYTLNVGVFLSDVPGPNMGNFKACPGSHLWVAEHARRFGPYGINPALRDLRGTAGETDELIARAGDAVVCHYNLVHARQWNASPHIRYAVFFRVYAKGHLTRWQYVMREPWVEWAGLAHLRPKNAGSTAD